MYFKYLISLIAFIIALPISAQTNIYVWKDGKYKYIPDTDSVTYEPAQNTYYLPNNVTFKMIPVVGGTFDMGAREKDLSTEKPINIVSGNTRQIEGPLHKVTVSDFAIGETEVTKGMCVITGDGVDRKASLPTKNTKDNKKPRDYIPFNQILAYIELLNAWMYETKQIPADMEFCLPTEAEWEFAARGGNKSQGYVWAGSDNPKEVAWYKDSNNNLNNVATKAPNELGLYDMSGNLSEWVADLFNNGSYGAKKFGHEDFYYQTSDGAEDPQGPANGDYRMLRGGSYNYHKEESRIVSRSPQLTKKVGTTNPSTAVTQGSNTAGFRLCLKKKK